MSDNVLTVDEAATLLKVSPETIVALLEAQEVAGRILEGSWRTTQRALLNYIDGASDAMGCICCPTDASGKPCCSGQPGCC